MEKGKKYLFENLRPNFKRLNTSKVNFRDDNDLLNLVMVRTVFRSYMCWVTRNSRILNFRTTSTFRYTYFQLSGVYNIRSIGS